MNIRTCSRTSVLHDNDVICGTNRRNQYHVGNKILRRLVLKHLEAYLVASKSGKSKVIASVVDHVHKNSSEGGGFVQKDPLTGTYEQVSDLRARDIVSQMFRKELSDKYKSSIGFKKTIRRAKKENKEQQGNSTTSESSLNRDIVTCSVDTQLSIDDHTNACHRSIISDASANDATALDGVATSDDTLYPMTSLTSSITGNSFIVEQVSSKEDYGNDEQQQVPDLLYSNEYRKKLHHTKESCSHHMLLDSFKGNNMRLSFDNTLMGSTMPTASDLCLFLLNDI